jgi:hypothetical protein
MRTTRFVFILTCALFGIRDRAVVAGQQPKYGVTVKVAKAAALAKAKTYSWTASQPSPIKTLDAQITAAVDRELNTLGLTKVASGQSDLVATYASIRRTDVDLKSKGVNTGHGREYAVGTLVVDLRDPATQQPLFRVRIDKPIDTEPEQAEAVINAAVTAMFEKYPARTSTKR